MFAQERQDKILKRVNEEGSVRVKELSAYFKVTEDCIRKDLSSMEKKGLLKKAYGGAVSVRPNPHLFSIEERMNMPDEERIEIAQKAIKLLKEDEVIYLDTSTTSCEMAKRIALGEKRVQVITNMVEVLNILAPYKSIPLVFIGGLINPERDGFCGSYSVEMLKSFKIDIAFIGVVGVDPVCNSVSTYHIDDGIMKATAIASSRHSYLLCENKKLKEDGNFVFGQISDATGIILGSEIKGADSIALKQIDIDIL